MTDVCVSRQPPDADGAAAEGPGAEADIPVPAVSAPHLRLLHHPADQPGLLPPHGLHPLPALHPPPPHPRPAPHHPDLPHHLRVHHDRGRRGEVRLNLNTHAAASGENIFEH